MASPDAVRKQLQASIAYVRARIYTIENDYAAKQLLSAYQDALVEMQKRIDAAFAANGSGEWSTRDANYLRRTNDLMNGISNEMEQLNVKIHNTLIDEQIRAYRASYYGNAWIVDKFSDPNYSPMTPVIPHEAVRAQLLFPYEGNTTWFRMEANRADFINGMRRSMIQSQIVGESVYQAQKRLSDALGLPITRRKLSDRQANSGNFYRTETIARTELLRSSNLGTHAIYDANADVVEEYEILATLDNRTCPNICAPLDGKRFPISDTEHIPPFHILCRCTTTAVTKSFASMGINAPEMAHGPRASMFGPVDGNLNYEQWAQAQGINRNMDGGLAELPAGKPVKSPGATPVRSKPLVAKGVMKR